MPTTTTIVTMFVTGALTAGSAQAADWLLLSRHGECAPIGTTLKRKLPDIPDVRTPDALSAYLEAKRLKFTRQRHQYGAGQAVEFQVPDAGLALLLVQETTCSNVAPRR